MNGNPVYVTFCKKLIDVVNNRMNCASDKFQKEMGRAYGQERAIVQALLALRKEMCFLSKVMDISAIPEKERRHYYQLVLDQAELYGSVPLRSQPKKIEAESLAKYSKK